MKMNKAKTSKNMKSGNADLLPAEALANKIFERFPCDFMFQLEVSEADALVSQNVIPHKKYLGGYMPYAFTQEGVAMLSSVLRSKRAVQMNISIMRVFVRIREYLATHKDVLKKLEEHDRQIKTLFGAVNKLLLPPPVKTKNKMGF